MSTALKITCILFVIFIMCFVNYLVIKKKIAVKYSFVWTIPFLCLFLFIIIPNFLTFFTDLFGFQNPSNMIFALLISLLLIISICLTVIVSKQKNQIRLLIQEVSLLKKDGR